MTASRRHFLLRCPIWIVVGGMFWLLRHTIQVDAFSSSSTARTSDTPTPNQLSSQKVYQYFCYGSNVLPSTMTNLRGIHPLNATAAVLPGYELVFLGSGGRLEPSTAFVVPSSRKQRLENDNGVVHGVMYTLTAEDFARVGWTEGVPFAYRWQRCPVYPYVGRAGEDVGSSVLAAAAAAAAAKPSESSTTTLSCEAFTLVSPKGGVIADNVPPSASYLDIIQRGARHWNLDASYQTKLAAIPTAKNLLIAGGLSGPLLRLAELSASLQGKQTRVDP